MSWFKKSEVGEFFLNEAHPYSKKRTIKLSHVAIVISGLTVIVLALGSIFEKRAETEREANKAAKEAKSNSEVPGNAPAGSRAQGSGSQQNGYLSLQSTYGGRPVSTGRQLTATQIIKRGESAVDVLPVGTQIKVELVGRVESTDSNSPVTALILQDAFSPVEALVIPRGTKVIGNGQLDTGRERLQVHFHTLVFPEWEQYSISGLAAMLDGSSGLEGDFSSGAFKRNASQFIGNFVGGLAEGMKDRTSVGQIGIPFEPGSLKNGVLNGVADSSLNYAKTSSEKMGQSGASIKVNGGLPFVLYLEREFHQ